MTLNEPQVRLVADTISQEIPKGPLEIEGACIYIKTACVRFSTVCVCVCMLVFSIIIK